MKDSTAIDRYVEILTDPAYIGMTRKSIADELGVCVETLWRWDQSEKIDWSAIKMRRRQRYDKVTPAIDDALIKRAKSGDVRAIELYFERFDGYIRTSKQIQNHELDESLIDDELKRLAERRTAAANAIAESKPMDAKGGDEMAGAATRESQATPG